MSFNGSGTFVINSAGQPVVSGTVISSTAFNALTSDLANGLSTCITKDGQTTPTADIPMGSNKITGLANGTAAGDAANLGQVQSTVAKLLGSVSGADTITAVGSPTVAAYAAGQMFYFVAAGANTGAVTINIDSLGAKNITRDGTTALAAGDIQSGEVCVIVYDGTQFQLVNGASQSASIVTENLTVNKATVLNESGGDNDTRIEGDTDANLLFVDASTDRIGVGTNAPALKLHAKGGNNNTLLIDNDGSRYTSTYIAHNGTTKAGFYWDNTNTGLYFGTSVAEPLFFTINGGTTATLDSSGNLGLGVTPSAWSGFKAFQLTNAMSLWAADNDLAYYSRNVYYDGSNRKYIFSSGAAEYIQGNSQHTWLTAPSGTAGNTITFTQAMTLTDAGRLGIATTSPDSKLEVTIGDNDGITIEQSGASQTGFLNFRDSDGNYQGRISYDHSTDALRFATTNTERARISSGGTVFVNKTSKNFTSPGWSLEPDGDSHAVASGTVILAINRQDNDGTLVEFAQAGFIEGTISVSGSTVSYNGGHLSRWSQTTDNTRIELLKGTVMSNLDQMAVWIDPETGEPQENEQLNCMKVSDVEGDVNVAGVFVNWDNDDDVFANDMNIAMTGDMIIRIAQGVTVQRGDLLMSAGDGTAKPQGDDIIRSKTIAKVTSNHVTCTYDDGSYCVPCVVMAC